MLARVTFFLITRKTLDYCSKMESSWNKDHFLEIELTLIIVLINSIWGTDAAWILKLSCKGHMVCML